jgi:hypothetical protein
VGARPHGLVPGLGAEPGVMAQGPRASADEAPPMPQEELGEPMPGPACCLRRSTGVLSAYTEVL